MVGCHFDNLPNLNTAFALVWYYTDTKRGHFCYCKYLSKMRDTNSNNIALPLFGVALLTGFSPAGTYTDQLTVTLSW